METATYRFNTSDLPGGQFNLIALGDIQYDGSKESSALKMLKETIRRGTEMGAFYIGMGDYTDFLSPSNREKLRGANLYDTSGNVIERAGQTLVDEIGVILAPTKGRWLGMLEGHHFQEFAAGDTSDMRLATILNTRHLGSMTMVTLEFQRGAKGPVSKVELWGTHGSGNGQTLASPISYLERQMKSYEADIYLVGHQTKLVHAVSDRLYHADHDTIAHLDRHLVGCGGFSRAIQVGRRQGQVPRGSYAEQGGMNPAGLGAPVITITPHEEKSPGRPKHLTREIRVTL